MEYSTVTMGWSGLAFGETEGAITAPQPYDGGFATIPLGRTGAGGTIISGSSAVQFDPSDGGWAWTGARGVVESQADVAYPTSAFDNIGTKIPAEEASDMSWAWSSGGTVTALVDEPTDRDDAAVEIPGEAGFPDMWQIDIFDFCGLGF